jgi:serine/threonine protein kinase
MSTRHALAVDPSSPPFDRFTHVEPLASKRGGTRSEAARHQLLMAREKHNPVGVLIKVTSKPGLVYEHDLDNEIRSLTTINRALPRSPYFPFIHEHGRLDDGRLYLVMSLFDEFPLTTTISDHAAPDRLVTHLRIAIEIARALTEIHRLEIVHVDLNPMNVLYRPSNDRPIIRIVDFESSYERARYANGEFYNPPTTPGYSAPEVASGPPDARSDVFSLGAVLYTLLAGYRWTDGADVAGRIGADANLDDELKSALLTATAADPGARYATIDAFLDALGGYLERIWPGRQW